MRSAKRGEGGIPRWAGYFARLRAGLAAGPLGNRSFRLLGAGQLASTIGDLCYAVALPALAHARFGAAGYGALMACMGFGALGGTIAAARATGMHRPAIVTYCVFLGEGIAISFVPYFGGLPGAAGAITVVGICNAFGNILIVTLLQRWAPPGLPRAPADLAVGPAVWDSGGAPLPSLGVPMPEALVYEFQGVTGAHYAAVSRHLGIDPETGEGDWPPGMLSHAAGTADDGTFIVSEVWSSREAQVAWERKLAPALAANGVTGMPRVRWVPLIAYHRD